MLLGYLAEIGRISQFMLHHTLAYIYSNMERRPKAKGRENKKIPAKSENAQSSQHKQPSKKKKKKADSAFRSGSEPEDQDPQSKRPQRKLPGTLQSDSQLAQKACGCKEQSSLGNLLSFFKLFISHTFRYYTIQLPLFTFFCFPFYSKRLRS